MLPVDNRSLVTLLRVPSVVHAAAAAASFANVAAFRRAAALTMCHSRGREGATCEAMRQTTAASRHRKDEALRRAQRWATKTPCDRSKARANGRFAEASAAATAAVAGGEGASEGMGLIKRVCYISCVGPIRPEFWLGLFSAALHSELPPAPPKKKPRKKGQQKRVKNTPNRTTKE